MNRIALALGLSLSALSFVTGCGEEVRTGGGEESSDDSQQKISSNEQAGEGGAGGGSTSSVAPDDGAEPCATLGDKEVCNTQCGGYPERVCEADANGKLTWGKCSAECNDAVGTPLVFVFDGKPVEYRTDTAASFDLLGRGVSMSSDWPTARTPWLALDRDDSGSIDDGRELFGSMTRLSSGRRAAQGFEALAELDDNHDGVLSAADPSFAKLVLWADADGDRVSSTREQTKLSESIVSIDLAYRTGHRCDVRSNCERERAQFTYRDASGALRTGEVVDVYIAFR